MNNYVSTEKSLKRWLKSRVKITMAIVVGFLIAGTVTFGAGEIPADGVYTNDYLLNTFQSTKVVAGKDGNLVIYSNGSVGYLLSDLQNDHSLLGIRKALSQHETHGNDYMVVTGALAGQGRFSEGMRDIEGAIILGGNMLKKPQLVKLGMTLGRIDTNDGTPITGDTNTVIGNENSPVVLGLVGGDMSVGFGKLDVNTSNLLKPEGATITSSKEKEDLQITRNGNSTVTINNGNVFGGAAGSTAVSLGNISAKGEKSITIKKLTATVKGDLKLNGNTTTTINGNTNLNINNGANGAGLTAGGIAAAIGGTATSVVNGNSNIVVNSKVDEKELSGLTVGLFGGGMAVSTLGGKASAETTGTTDVTINNGLSIGVTGGGMAVSTDASQYLKEGTLGGKIDENGNFFLDKKGIPQITVSGLKDGGTSIVNSGDINVNLKGTTAAAVVLGNGIAVSHQNAPQGKPALENNQGSKSTVSAGNITVNVDLTKNLNGAAIGNKGVIKEVKEALAQLKNIVDPGQGTNVGNVIKEMQDAVKVLKDGGIVVGLSGNGLAVARDKGISEVTAKDITMDLKSGYIVGAAVNGIAVGNASSTVKAESSIINIDGAEVIGVTGSGIALDHSVVKDDVYSKTEIKNTTVNLNSGSADGIFGGGIAVTKDHADSRAEVLTSGKSIININGGKSDKFGYNHIASIVGTHGSFDKIAEAGKNVAVAAGGVASRNGYTKVAESEININGGTVNGDIIAGGIAVAGGVSEVGKSTINITGGDIQGSIYGTGIAIAEDSTVGNVDKNKTSAKVENSILNINGYKNSLEKISGFNEINIDVKNTKAVTDGHNTQLTITDRIEVGTGKLTNEGAIVFANEKENSTLITVKEGAEVLNKGLIVVDNGDKVVDNTGNIAKDVKNIGKIQVNGITSADEEKFDVQNLFNGKFTNVGMIVGEDGKAILTEGEDVVAGDVTVGEITADATKDNVTLEHVNITDGGTINSDVVNVIGNVTNTADFEIADGTLNIDSVGNIKIGDNTEMKISNGTVIGSSDIDIKFAGENSKLVLNNSNVKAGVIGENTTNGVVDFTGTNNSFNGKITAREININKGNAVEFGENAVGAGTINLNGDAKIAVGKENTEGVYTQNFFHNSDGSLDVQGTGNIVIRTKNFEGEKVTVDFGENNTFGTDLINKLDTTNVYMIKDGEDLTDGRLELVYNTKLFGDSPVLNNINNAAQVVNDKFSDNPETRKIELDKHYSANIYSETVKAAYDNIKLNEEAVESLARKSEIGKWTAEGKALYSKNEYDRKGIIREYSSEVESTGLMAAFGYGVNETTTAGIAFSGVKQDVDTDTGSADADLFYVGLYGNKVYGNYDFTAGLGYQFGKYESDNNILAGTGDKYDSQAVSGYVQGRYTADLGDGLSVQPKVKLGYTYTEQDDAKDSYFGVEDAEISTFDAEVGFDVVKSVQLEKSKADVKFGVSYVRTMGDTDEEFTGRFYGTKASEGFNVLGAELAENVVKFNLGAEVANEKGFFYNGGFTYEFGSNETEAYGVNIGVGYKF